MGNSIQVGLRVPVFHHLPNFFFFRECGPRFGFAFASAVQNPKKTATNSCMHQGQEHPCMCSDKRRGILDLLNVAKLLGASPLGHNKRIHTILIQNGDVP